LLNKFELNGRIRKMLLSKQGEYNLTNQQMADILHITPRTYSNILSDKTHEIRISVVYYAVKYFNVNIYELIKE
jgi:transcriptional regulator with XRE-family HTH domain